ncbi:MAG: hypothetical protein H0W65_06355 [Sphingomonas sp.]|uniref:hypothetical protein n=1 Tax=Sphingomonas sp. TaxID=28214 RepID=UPI0017DBF6FB|nr:hypothetical protein [Sphingomonas sp.]MBA3667326.1 hypothetical protein [Sphingomonas sp.]
MMRQIIQILLIASIPAAALAYPPTRNLEPAGTSDTFDMCYYKSQALMHLRPTAYMTPYHHCAGD